MACREERSGFVEEPGFNNELQVGQSNLVSALEKVTTEGMNVPGNSVSDVGERINGGAVREDRSPVKVAIL